MEMDEKEKQIIDVLTEEQYKRLEKIGKATMEQILAKQFFLKGIDTHQKMHYFCFRNPNNYFLPSINSNTIYNALCDIQNGRLSLSSIPDIEI